MADREERPNPLLQPYASGRSAFEVPGQAQTPLNLEREERLALSVSMGNYDDLAPGVDARGLEGFRWSSAAPAAGRHAALRVTMPFGFRVVLLRNMSGVAVLNLYVPGTGAAIAAGTGIIRRTVQARAMPLLVTEIGDVPAPAVAGSYLPSPYDLDTSNWGTGLWVSGTSSLELIAAVAATAVDCVLWLTSPRV